MPGVMSAAEPLWLPLGELLVDRGLLSARQLELALDEQRRTGRRLGEVLVAFGFVSQQALASTLLEQVGLAAEVEVEPPVEADAESVAVEFVTAAEPARSEPSDAAEPPRRAGHLAEADDEAEPRPIVFRVEDLPRNGTRQRSRVAELEALVSDFERRSAEIQTRIAEVRGVLGELRA
jgi:sugar phosphate isomerase/epimerase